jgi:hypothetical protein
MVIADHRQTPGLPSFAPDVVPGISGSSVEVSVKNSAVVHETAVRATSERTVMPQCCLAMACKRTV